MKAKFSAKTKAVRQRIKNLPQIYEKSIRGNLKMDAVGVAKTFKQGIINDDLNLTRNATSTIKRKRGDTPLYHTGSYADMMRVYRDKKRWVVAPKNGIHKPSGFPYKAILEVHEFGKIINTKHATIVIPPRPARTKAFIKYMKTRSKRDSAQRVKRAVTDIINTGKSKYLEVVDNVPLD